MSDRSSPKDWNHLSAFKQINDSESDYSSSAYTSRPTSMVVADYIPYSVQ